MVDGRYREKRSGEPELPTRYATGLWLESGRKRELQLARSGTGCFAGDGAGSLDVAAGVAGVDVIDCVDGIEAELLRHVLPDVEALGKRKISVVEVGSEIGVAADVAKCVKSRGRDPIEELLSGAVV